MRTYDDWKTTDTTEDASWPRLREESDEVAFLYARVERLEEMLRLANEEIGALRWKLAEARK